MRLLVRAAWKAAEATGGASEWRWTHVNRNARLHLDDHLRGCKTSMYPLLALAAAYVAPAVRLPTSSRCASIACSATNLPTTPFKPSLLGSLVRGESAFKNVPCTTDENADECVALCTDEECTTIASVALLLRSKVGAYFGLWFFLSTCYSVTNKQLTNALPLPITVATATLAVGSLFVSLLWATKRRPAPKMTRGAVLALLPVGAFHAIGHAAGTYGTAAGSVAFAQVVKAAGPVYACVLSALVLRQPASRNVMLSLLPIVGGVALATVKELSFAWGALLGAVVSDLALALRNVYSKLALSGPSKEGEERLSPANLFGVLTVLSTAVSIPLALAMEGPQFGAVWAAAAAQFGAGKLALYTTLTGLYFYAYSEVAMKALNNVHPVTHAIGNTMRRVVIMLVCIGVFGTPMTPLAAMGSVLAIGGSFLYSMVKAEEKRKAKEAVLDAKLATALPLKVDAEKKVE